MTEISNHRHEFNGNNGDDGVKIRRCRFPRKRPRSPGNGVGTAVLVDVKCLGVPLTSPTTGEPVNSFRLQPDRPYTIGRSIRRCQFVFADRRVGKQHCQIIYDSVHQRLYIVDGSLVSIPQFGNRPEECCSVVGASMNGVFVNGIRVREGVAVELSDGDRVSFACAAENLCSNAIRIGFVLEKIVFGGLIFQGFDNPHGLVVPVTLSCPRGCKRIFASRVEVSSSSVVLRASLLSSECRRILCSDDPISYIRKYGRCSFSVGNGVMKSNVVGSPAFDIDRQPVKGKKSLLCHSADREFKMKSKMQSTSGTDRSESVVSSERNGDLCAHREPVHTQDKEVQVVCDIGVAKGSLEMSSFNHTSGDFPSNYDGVSKNKTWRSNVGSPPGKNFYLNRLSFMDYSSSSHHSVISLPELLYPVESISQMFIATFTSDIVWFMSSCEIPSHLPVTVACHNTERCWSSSPDKRTSAPYPYFPNLTLVHPPFPEDIAFGKDSTRQGIACHHPKLFVLQRDDSIRVIITSANLVSTQWNAVTNTIWWQDFPHRSAPDYTSLFAQFDEGKINQDSKTDFASQLAGFMASLLTDVPSQAHWIVELAKYDFGRATGHLVASVPGIHSYKTSNLGESRNLRRFPCQADHDASRSFGVKFLGSVESSVVGLSYLFHNAKDSNGAKLMKLASFLQTYEHAKELPIVLTRNKNVPADPNAVSILVPHSNKLCEGDCVQLGFLPRNIAKWISPLWDVGFFSLSGYVCPKEALAAALGGNSKKVQLMLHVSQGPKFEDISKMMQPEHVTALCSLIASIQRCTGLWRLQEVLGRYKWPESLHSDFVYGASSIGAINARFLADFSAAAGKKSLEFESEESDPEWGCWNARHESKSPSIRIIFPTIDRVKNACNGIYPSKRILCFSEKTWQSLRSLDILHDAIPHPYDRVGHPMHTKVARRRFYSKRDATSFGWVYCGSHNFSAAAWGRPVSEKLHICNYELGIIFTFPETEKDGSANKDSPKLDDIVLPYIVPAPKYGPGDRPATRKAMWEALAELTEQERQRLTQEAATEEIMEENPDEDEVVEATDFVPEEKEEEKAYAEVLWSQVDSSQSS